MFGARVLASVGSTDWVGIAAVITSISTLIGTIQIHRNTRTKGPETLGEIATKVESTTARVDRNVVTVANGKAELPPEDTP